MGSRLPVQQPPMSIAHMQLSYPFPRAHSHSHGHGHGHHGHDPRHGTGWLNISEHALALCASLCCVRAFCTQPRAAVRYNEMVKIGNGYPCDTLGATLESQVLGHQLSGPRNSNHVAPPSHSDGLRTLRPLCRGVEVFPDRETWKTRFNRHLLTGVHQPSDSRT